MLIDLYLYFFIFILLKKTGYSPYFSLWLKISSLYLLLSGKPVKWDNATQGKSLFFPIPLTFFA